MTAADLSACDREPIHVPGSVQPHGALLALREPDFVVIQASANAASLFGVPSEVLGRPIADILGAQVEIARDANKLPPTGEPVLLRAVRVGGKPLNVVGHRAEGLVVLEFEPAEDGYTLSSLHPIVAQFIAKVQGVPSVAELARLTAAEVRAVTGFDRALVYRFEPDGTGVVVAEDGSGRLPSYQDHRFPAADIPKQARELYRRNRLRLIPDATYTPVPLVPPLNPLTNRHLDLTYSSLRSVSPVHLEYMRNMETAASMSVSVMKDGELWGLISCHHHDPRAVPFEARTACDLIAQVFALQIAAREHAIDYERRVEIKSTLNRLLSNMAQAEDYAAGLLSHPDELLGFVRAAGAAVVTDSRCGLVGLTPSESKVRELASWLFRAVKREVYHTDALGAAFPTAADYADSASGLLAVSVSKLHPTTVIWFRPEVVETIRWGGDPRKLPEPGDVPDRLHPRKSFATWSQTVRGRAVPWLPSEIEGAAELRNAVLGIVLRQAEEMAALNVELQRSNRELEAFSYSVSHDLRAPLRHIVGYAELLKEVAKGKLAPGELKHADTIIESSEYAGKLVDNLLAYSRMGRAAMERVRDRHERAGGRGAEGRVGRVRRPPGAVGGRPASDRDRRPHDDEAGGPKSAGQRAQIHERSRRSAGRDRVCDRRGRARVPGAGQRRRIRHEVPGQAVRGVPAAAPVGGLRGHRDRAGERPPDRRAARRPRLGRGRGQPRRDVLLHAARPGGVTANACARGRSRSSEAWRARPDGQPPTRFCVSNRSLRQIRVAHPPSGLARQASLDRDLPRPRLVAYRRARLRPDTNLGGLTCSSRSSWWRTTRKIWN